VQRKFKQQFEVRKKPSVVTLADLDEISGWLGTYRERMARARTEDQRELANPVVLWDDSSSQRQAELA
jgi:hypothetical protein